MKVWAFFILTLTISFNGISQSISGTIVGTNGVTPLKGIEIQLLESKTGSITNSKGYFDIKTSEEGTFKIAISGLGYETQIIDASTKNQVEIKLAENIYAIKEFAVEASSISGGINGSFTLPGSVSYISPKKLQSIQTTDINRMLNTIAGVNIQEEDGFGLRPNIGLRGSGAERSSKITIMEDGILMAPAPYASPAAYYFPSAGRMSSIEVIKGSSQIKFGPQTNGGVINLISTQIPTKLKGQVNLSYGSFGSRKAHVNVGDNLGRISYLAEVFHYGSNGFKSLPNNGNTGFSKTDLLGKIKYRSKSNAKIYQSLLLKVMYGEEESNETYLGLTDSDFNTNPYARYLGSAKDKMTNSHKNLSLKHYALISSNLEITTTAYYNEFSRNWYKLDKVTDSTGKNKIAAILSNPENYKASYHILQGNSSQIFNSLDIKANNRTYKSMGVQTKLNYQFNTKGVSHNTEVSIRVHYDYMDRFQWVDNYIMDQNIMQLNTEGIHGTESNRIESANAISSYINHVLVWKKLKVIPGVRYENIFLARKDFGKADPERTGVNVKNRANFVEAFIPGFGATYEFTKSLNVFAGVHKGFSPPGNTPETNPEESVNYEIGTRLQTKELKYSITGYYNDYSNLLGSDLAATGGTGSNNQFNAGNATTYGLETELAIDLALVSKIPFGLPIELSYTYTSATFDESFDSNYEPWGTVIKGDEMPYIPKHQVTLHTGFSFTKLDINLFGKYASSMRTIAGSGIMAQNQKTDEVILFDIASSYQLPKNFKLTATIKNIFNREYIVARRPAGVRPGLPRLFEGGIRYNF